MGVKTRNYSQLPFDSTFYIFNLILPILFIGLAFLVMPISQVFVFDTDEGQELIKAVLYSQGYSLYDPIWSDQPPLLTVVLSAWFKVWGESIVAARSLILLFATLLVWAFANLIRLSLGKVEACLAVIMLAISGNFLRLSVSVMIGIPCLSLAILSLYLLVLAQKQNQLYLLLLSGISLAFSLQFKMFTIFLLPIWSILIFESEWQNKRQIFTRNIAIKLAIWLGAIAFTFLLVGITNNSLQLQSFFQFHLTEDLHDVFVNENSLLDVSLMYLQEIDYTLLAILGLGTVVKSPTWLAKIPLFWLMIATVILIRHKPVWYHHYLLLSIPLTWLALYGLHFAFSFWKSKYQYQSRHFLNAKSGIFRKIVLGLCILEAIATPVKIAVLQWQNQILLHDSQVHWEIVTEIERYKTATNWLFTDNPSYAFYAGLKVPPEIAVLSRKRVAAGQMTPEYLESLLDRYDPEQIILERFPEVRDAIAPNLEANYSKIETNSNIEYFLLNSLN
ncbi:MAG: glycosyltransferase family 39 protein, partial [Jaaginema sp. PMC 1079.18]|nr:glycosyltransferase family 39 protein [Jaaginema sp. PMC 1079.18]